MTVEYVLIVCI